MTKSYEDDLENMLIHPCKCKRDPRMRCHVGCLREFVSRQVKVVGRPNSKTLQWKEVKCPHCERDFPLQVRRGSDFVDLVSFRRPQRPCLVLEKTTKKEKNRVYTNEVVLLTPGKHSRLVLGHGPNSDLRMADISTSVSHSQITFENNMFLLYDDNSRFGTMVELRKPFPVQNNGVMLQVENKVFKIFTEGQPVVRTMKKRKFRRFDMTLNRTHRTVVMNLATRMKVFPAASLKSTLRRR